MILTEENKNLCGIYWFKNSINDKVYIGSTKCFNTRYKQHIVELKGGYHANPKLQNFVNKYGLDKLQFEIIELTNLEELKDKEQYYLDSNNNKFNINVKADRPNVERNFTKEDIENIAKLYNSGKDCAKISRIYFGNKNRHSYFASIVKGEIYSEFKYLFDEYKPTTNRSFDENLIHRIADLYNNGKTGSQISEILYNSRNQRAKINNLIKGKGYPEYKHLFNYREYNQTGRKFSQETKDKISKANKGNPNIGGKGIKRKPIGKLSKEIVLYIRQNPDKISQSKLALKFEISKSLVKDIQKMRTYLHY